MCVKYSQGVTERCRLSWLTNSCLVQYMSPTAGGGGGCGVSANEYSCAHLAQINFEDLTPYLPYKYSPTTSHTSTFLTAIFHQSLISIPLVNKYTVELTQSLEFLNFKEPKNRFQGNQFRQAMQPGGPVRQPDSYSVPSPYGMFKNSSTVISFSVLLILYVLTQSSNNISKTIYFVRTMSSFTWRIWCGVP